MNHSLGNTKKNRLLKMRWLMNQPINQSKYWSWCFEHKFVFSDTAYRCMTESQIGQEACDNHKVAK